MQLEVFFDYVCPYCYQGHKNLLKLLPKYPKLAIIWRPCEAHPRPEPARIHSDLAIQGMYYVQERQGDLWKYHALVYAAHFDQGRNISDLSVLEQLAAECCSDGSGFHAALMENRYAQKVEEGNRAAWEEYGFSAVPSYRSGSYQIGSRDSVLVPPHKLEQFLASL